jgi:hypothetical protein
MAKEDYKFEAAPRPDPRHQNAGIRSWLVCDETGFASAQHHLLKYYSAIRNAALLNRQDIQRERKKMKILAIALAGALSLTGAVAQAGSAAESAPKKSDASASSGNAEKSGMSPASAETLRSGATDGTTGANSSGTGSNLTGSANGGATSGAMTK